MIFVALQVVIIIIFSLIQYIAQVSHIVSKDGNALLGVRVSQWTAITDIYISSTSFTSHWSLCCNGTVHVQQAVDFLIPHRQMTSHDVVDARQEVFRRVGLTLSVNSPCAGVLSADGRTVYTSFQVVIAHVPD